MAQLFTPNFDFSSLRKTSTPDDISVEQKARNLLSNITIYNKYAKYLKTKKRRETWEEITDRSKEAMLKKYAYAGEEFQKEIAYAFDNYVKPKKVLNSMRFSQFSGLA